MTSTLDLASPTIHRPQSRHLIGQAALLGVSLFLVSLATFAPETAPDPGRVTAPEVRRYAAENAETIQVNAMASLVSLLLLVAFVAGLAQQIRQARPSSIGPRVMTALTGVIAAQILFVTAASSIFGRPSDLAGVTDGAVVTFYQVMAVAEWLYSLTVVAPCMMLVATYSWLAFRCRLIARWVCWTGFVAAFAGAVTAVALAVPGNHVDPFLGPLLGWWLWPLTVGLASSLRWWRRRKD